MGCQGINKANKLRKLDIPDITYSEDHSLFIYISCRAKHNNIKGIRAADKRQQSTEHNAAYQTRSQVAPFDFKTHWFFCVASLLIKMLQKDIQ